MRSVQEESTEYIWERFTTQVGVFREIGRSSWGRNFEESQLRFPGASQGSTTNSTMVREVLSETVRKYTISQRFPRGKSCCRRGWGFSRGGSRAKNAVSRGTPRLDSVPSTELWITRNSRRIRANPTIVGDNDRQAQRR